MMYFSHLASLTSPMPIARWEPTRPGLNGSGIFAVEQLHNANGDLVDFYVSVPSLLETSGGLFIRHKGIPVSPWGSAYAIYANARLALHGPTLTKAELPPRWTAPPDSSLIWLDGANITNVSHHYASPKFTHQRRIEPGYYSLEAWAATGSDALDVDGLGELVSYNGNLLNQLHVKVTPLSQG